MQQEQKVSYESVFIFKKFFSKKSENLVSNWGLARIVYCKAKKKN
jgi:hypothetical protein